MDRVSLKAGNSVAMLAPDVGGGVASLILAGHEILRRESDLPASPADPASLGEFPMAPWVNRVANGRFTWQGREIRVAEGPGRDPQGLHGIAWRRPWSVLERSENAACLGITWDGGSGWPFAFRFTRRFVLTESVFTIEARLTNLGHQLMPAALGFHPYFCSRGAIISAQTSGGWISDNSGLPAIVGLESVAADLQSGLVVDHAPLDNCFIGWDGVVVIDWPTHSLRMHTDPALHFLQIYSPEGTGFFCVEPQSAVPDALNRDLGSSGICVLAPGAQLGVSLHLALVPPAKDR
jgi:aldose 1-epimerase